jgi:hypothetical protein
MLCSCPTAAGQQLCSWRGGAPAAPHNPAQPGRPRPAPPAVPCRAAPQKSRRNRRKVEPQVTVESAAVKQATGQTPATPEAQAESTYVLVMGAFFSLILIEGLLLAASVSAWHQPAAAACRQPARPPSVQCAARPGCAGGLTPRLRVAAPTGRAPAPSGRLALRCAPARRRLTCCGCAMTAGLPAC